MTGDVLAQAVDVLAEAGITATGAESFGPRTLDVPVDSWVAAHEQLRDQAGLSFFDFLTASDELADGFRIVTHLADFWGGSHVEHLLVRTLVPRAAPRLPSLTDVYAGANWHEREMAEMFGIGFDGHPNLVPLLLPDGFEGHPLRKEFVLASRVAKTWPGAKEPGESDHTVAAPAGPAVAPERPAAAGAEPPAAATEPPAAATEPPAAATERPAAGVERPAAKAERPAAGVERPAAKKTGSPSRRRTLPAGVPDQESWGPRPPGSPDPDPLAPARTASAPTRPRRSAGERRPAGDRRAAGDESPPS